MITELKKRMKVIKTCNLYLSFFILGASISITGPCLLDLQHMVNTGTRQMAFIYTARSTGYVAGALFGAIFLDFFKSKQSVLTACNFMVTITMFGIPWSRNVELLSVFMIMNGFTLGAIETGGNVICLQLWGKDSDPFFQALHFTAGLGCLISPLIAAPFLDYLRDMPPTIYNGTDLLGDIAPNLTFNISLNETNYTNTMLHIPRIVYPFSMIGAFALLVTILNLSICIISPTEDGIISDPKAHSSNKSTPFMFVTVLFSFLLLMVIAGTEISIGQTLTTYAAKGQLHLTTRTGSYMTSAFWATFTIGRLAAVFLAMKISSLILLIGNISIVSVSAIILLFFMPNEWALWLASVISGIGMSSSYAAAIGFIGCYIYISNKISGIITVGSAAGEMVGPFLITYLIETIPEIFAFLIAGACVLMIFLTFVLHCTFQKDSGAVIEQKTNKCYVESDSSKEIKESESRF